MWRAGLATKETATMPEFVLGFKALADKLGPNVVGDPLQDQIQVDENYALQMTTLGLLWFSRGGNQAHFFRRAPKAELYKPHVFHDPGTAQGPFPVQPK